uniref:Putative secreted peptide n=1 Tax=Anopheles braziliensis TaxID=58242 RepID=A0A2M3ZPI3_9DIPT
MCSGGQRCSFHLLCIAHIILGTSTGTIEKHNRFFDHFTEQRQLFGGSTIAISTATFTLHQHRRIYYRLSNRGIACFLACPCVRWERFPVRRFLVHLLSLLLGIDRFRSCIRRQYGNIGASVLLSLWQRHLWLLIDFHLCVFFVHLSSSCSHCTADAVCLLWLRINNHCFTFLCIRFSLRRLQFQRFFPDYVFLPG